MMKIARITMRHLATVACLLSVLLTGHFADCNADSPEKSVQHSKDYKNYPAGTPEAILTALVESDLGDIYNRDDDDRYPLWWELTEIGGVPENDGYLKLYINSYQIMTTGKSQQLNEQTLSLVLDVRTVQSSGNPIDPKIIRWRNVPVYVCDIRYSSNTNHFIEAVFGEMSEIIKNEQGYFPVQSNKHKWVFPVQMINKKGKWLIAMESLPFQTAYVSSEINFFREEMNRELAMNNVCQGKRKIDSYIMERQLDYVKKEIGDNLKKFRAKFCSVTNLEIRSNFLEYCKSTIERLITSAKD